MSTSLPEAVNYQRLAEQKQELQGTIELAKFTRLMECIQGGADEVEVTARFSKGRSGRTLISGTARVDIRLRCQQCLETMSYGLRVKTRSLVVASEEEANALEEDEFLVADGERIRLVDVFEDDLLLGLPMVARHEQACGTAEDSSPEADEQPADTYKPFAGLADLKDEILKQ